MKIRTLIVDDEVLSRRGVELRLRGAPEFEIVAQCANGREALAAIQQYKPDLVFLDIQMPGMSGFEVLTHLPQESLPVVVFVTAYDQYAIQAFEARAVDYLLKPIDDVRFQAALTRVCEHVRAKSAADQRDRLMQIIAEITGCGELILDEVLEHGRKAIEGRRPEVLPIRQGRETVRVPVASIQWIDAAGDYMCIHAGGDTHILRGTMKELEEILDPEAVPARAPLDHRQPAPGQEPAGAHEWRVLPDPRGWPRAEALAHLPRQGRILPERLLELTPRSPLPRPAPTRPPASTETGRSPRTRAAAGHGGLAAAVTQLRSRREGNRKCDLRHEPA